MSQALYRRYRPETFAEVIGQEQVTGPLTAALGRDRVNHAYLFSGPRGCGKTTSARILARCLNCAHGPTITPCGECESCRDLARGGPGSLDVVEIDAASHGGVDDARSLRERAVFAPARDRYKVFIIDEAHMVSPQGFNALLKIVEEPPPHVRFVFATTEPDKVIGTIRSRTHHYPFRLVPPERLQNYLAEVCEAEGVTVAEEVLPLVVRAGGGSVRDSLSVLDQLIGGAGSDGVDYACAVSLLGYTDAALLDDFIDGLAAGDGARTFTVIDRVIGTGIDPRRFIEDLLQRLRDLIVVAAVPDGAAGVLRTVPSDQLERMTVQSERLGRAELSRFADVVNTALTGMTGATSPRLQLELLCARLLLPGTDHGNQGLSARVDRLEKQLTADGPAPARPAPVPVATRVDPYSAAPADGPAPADRPDTNPASPATPAAPKPAGRSEPASDVSATDPIQEATSPPGGGSGTELVRQRWASVLNALSGLRRSTWSLVSQHAQVVDFDGERLLLRFPTTGLINSFDRGKHQEYLRQAITAVLSLDCRIETTTDGAPPMGARTAAAVPPASRGSAPARSGSARPTPATNAREPRAEGAGSIRSRGPSPDPPSPRAPWRGPDQTTSLSSPGRPATVVTPSPDPAVAVGPGPASPAAPSQRADRFRPSSVDLDDIPPPDEPLAEDGPPEEVTSTRPRRSAPQPAPPPVVTLPKDDQPSADDLDVEGSGLVGAPVIEKMLGGRIIEERTE